MSLFKKAERKKAKARIGICGPAGSGKTWGALELAFGIGGKIAVIDTEHGSAELYSNRGEYDVAPIKPPYTVEKYIDLIKQAEADGYDIIIIDSLTHAWAGEGGLLDQQGKIADSGRGNSYTAWRQITPLHNKLIDTMLQSPAHVIATMRSKTEYTMEEDSLGKKVPKKVGMAPVQRDGMDYEFTVVFDVDQSRHISISSKDRTDLFNGFNEAIKTAHGVMIREWLDSGAEIPESPVKRKEEIKGEIALANSAKDVDFIAAETKAERETWPQAWQDGMNTLLNARHAEFSMPNEEVERLFQESKNASLNKLKKDMQHN